MIESGLAWPHPSVVHIRNDEISNLNNPSLLIISMDERDQSNATKIVSPMHISLEIYTDPYTWPKFHYRNFNQVH